jgi:hypothetical protein
MCVVSDKLKLCTCKNAAETLTHYWVLYRHVKGKEESIMGLSVLPAIIDPGIDTLNRELLLELLNNGNAFDEPLYPVNRDGLQLSFGLKDDSRLDYGFLYKKNVWVSLEYDFFDWFTHHDEIKQGKIKTALKKTK